MQQFLLQHAPHIDSAEVDKQMVQMQEELKKKGQTLDDFYRAPNQTKARCEPVSAMPCNGTPSLTSVSRRRMSAL